MSKTIWKTMGCLAALLLFLMLCTAAAAEVRITFTPENPKMGEYVDVTVTPDREGAKTVRYSLSTGSGSVFKGEDDKHFTASFRPREEATYTLSVTVVYGKKDEETASVTIPVSGKAPDQAGRDVLYSQKDGWWHNKVYSKTHKRSVEKAGCAIFTLSHALQRMGFEGEELQPDKLATRYSRMYIANRGTDNERLLATAGEDFGFETHQDLIESPKELVTWFRRGCYFSFMIVNGHIALADGLSEDGTKVHIVDSAPGATYERIKNGVIYYMKEDGTFEEAATPEAIPGCRYFFETQEYGGLEYWLDISYCAKQGMRPIRAAWLKLGETPVKEFEYAGALITKVTTTGDAQRVKTRDLQWTTLGSEKPQLVIVTKKKGATYQDGAGKKKDGFNKALPYGTMLIALEITDKSVYVAHKGTFGYVARDAVDVLDVSTDDFQTGLVSINGRTAGTAPVNVRRDPSAKGKTIGEWKPGTPVAVAAKDGEFYLVEGKGLRGWVQNKFLTLEGEDSDGQKVDEGE